MIRRLLARFRPRRKFRTLAPLSDGSLAVVRLVTDPGSRVSGPIGWQRDGRGLHYTVVRKG